MSEKSVLGAFGDIETDKDDDMIVRVIGYNIGSAAGWFHFNGGWCVMAPDFKPNDDAELKFGIPYHKYEMVEHKGLIVDFYAGQIALVEHLPKGAEVDIGNPVMKVLWNGPLKVI
jgi:hypothetical protein